jgi:two-component system, NarL family, sensor histidine kinase DesK
VTAPAVGYRAAVDTPPTAGPLAGAEERKLRAARRFGRIGLITTVAWMLVVPAYIVFFDVYIVGIGPGALWLPVLIYAAAVGLHLWRIREHTRSLGARAPTWFVVAAAPVGLGLALAGLATGFGGYMWSLVAGILLGDIVGGMRARHAAVWVVSATLLVFGLGYLVVTARGEPFTDMVWVLVGCAAFFVATMWVVDVERLWWLKAVTDMDDARRAAAELATARERLRLADDLHDILGHALEVVAFKSELASRLQEVDPARARAEMEEVQRVARQSLTEVRAMVRETRGTDLVTELAGARAVLQSAGIALVVRGDDPASLAPTARNVLGRVLREAMTNVLRHAEPSHCTIEVEVRDGQVRLRVVNDGSLPADGADTGTGLAALSRYLDEHAGRLDAERNADGTFRLDAVLPAGAR